MGGDHAPAAPVAGALLALAELADTLDIQLVGRPADIEAEMRRNGGVPAALASRVEIVPATEVIEMGEKPSAAIRGKRDSSMVVGLKLQAEGKSDGFVSAGNTGAQMAASTVVLRLHEGLTRPAIGTLLPSDRGIPVVMLDAGANVDCSPQELVQFARLGSVYAEDILGRANPSVALLSVGEEPEKGSLAVKEANQLLAASGLNFVGNIEGHDLAHGVSPRGPVDVAVCDGFTGNVVLKFYEAVAPIIFAQVQRHGAPASAVDAVAHLYDYEQYGGAPLLGVRGVSIIGHGKSTPEAVKNAIRVALLAVEHRMSEHIGRALRGTPANGANGNGGVPA
ncbi:MAG: phosphate acyltransferase PlsX [Gemmatimonadetes bacterium]|nr:phosphate acyltransferase PlsX [Gemmatimonadota bacterium]